MNFESFGEEECLHYARIAEAAERYVDMCNAMKQVVKKKTAAGKKLEVEERNLLSVAYKNVVGTKRSSWRALEAGTFPDSPKELVDEFKKVVETELETICLEVVDLLEILLKKVDTEEKDETTVFYYKMKGDYYRYLSEFIKDEQKLEGFKGKTKASYKSAMDIAEDKLAETHPTRLGLALNFSVCYYEILKEPAEACTLAKKAFDAAIEKLDTLNDASYKDSTLIMQLLRDNLTLWTSETDDAAAPADGATGNP